MTSLQPANLRQKLYVYGNNDFPERVPLYPRTYKKGELGRLQYMTCAHYQDMEGWPEYWEASRH